jgi:uncharacterized protein
MSEHTPRPGGDPRIALAGGDSRWRIGVRGLRCTACAYPAADPFPRCPLCAAPMADAVFGPSGTVWSSTVIRVPIPGRTPPYGVAYVDLDDGPRVTVHAAVETDDAAQGVLVSPVPVGARVRIRGVNATGDVEVEVMER